MTLFDQRLTLTEDRVSAILSTHRAAPPAPAAPTPSVSWPTNNVSESAAVYDDNEEYEVVNAVDVDGEDTYPQVEDEN